MDPTDNGLFRLAERRMSWVDQRQSVLARNIANANTPDYKATDVAPFEASLIEQGVSVARTDPAHLQGSSAAAQGRAQRPTSKAPDGNTVSLEEQLGKVADTASTQELVTNLYRKYQGMFRIALGRSG